MRRRSSILLTHIVLAHQVGMSVGTYTPTTDGVDASITFARGEADAHLIDALKVTRGGEPCMGTLAHADATEADGMRFLIRFVCDAR